MSEKPKTFASSTSKNVKPKRPSTVSVTPSTSKSRMLPTPVKGSRSVPRPKTKASSSSVASNEVSLPDFDDVQRQVAYGKFLRTMLEDCLVDEKIEREETQLDIQMSLLADRFHKTVDQLDKTSKRLKDIKFATEQKRLMLLKSKHCDEFYKMTEESQAGDIVKALNSTEEDALDKLRTKSVDFGYTKESGHKQLLDAVNDAIDGLDQIKKHSKLDENKFKEYELSGNKIEKIEKERMDLESLKSDFDVKYPEFSENLLKEASETIAKMMNDDSIVEEDENDDTD